jgi:hypothetical protein
MNRDKEYGTPNPKAASELSQFAFIIGKWRCDARVKGEDGTWQPYQATWVGSYILDGHVIADEYRMTNQTGELIVHGMSFRSSSVEKKTWVMRWLNATGSSWLELGPEKLGGVRVAPRPLLSISSIHLLRMPLIELPFQTSHASPVIAGNAVLFSWGIREPDSKSWV